MTDRVDSEALTPPPGADIEELAFLVLMEATKSAEDDLRQIMAEIKATVAAKAHLRQLLCAVRRDAVAATSAELRGRAVTFAKDGLGGETAYHRIPLPVPDAATAQGYTLVPTDLHRGRVTSAAAINAVLCDLQGRLDSSSELSEMMSLRLQMAMDRRSKLVEALSNIMKKIDSTQETVVSNLKEALVCPRKPGART